MVDLRVRARTPSRKTRDNESSRLVEAAKTPVRRSASTKKPSTVRKSSQRDSQKHSQPPPSAQRRSKKSVVVRRVDRGLPSPPPTQNRDLTAGQLSPELSPEPSEGSGDLPAAVEEVQFRVQYRVFEEKVFKKGSSEDWSLAIDPEVLATNMKDKLAALCDGLEGTDPITTLKVGKSFVETLEGSDGVEKSLQQLKEWKNGKQERLLIVERVYQRKKDPPKASQTPKARQTPTVALLEEARAAGALVGQSIASKWMCSINTCSYYGSICFYEGRNVAENHVRVASEPHTAWAAAISKGTATVDEPPNSVYRTLYRLHMQGKTGASDGSSNARKRRLPVTSPSRGVSVNLVIGGEEGRRLFEDISKRRRSSSPRRSPEAIMSSPTDPHDLLDEFFEFLRKDSAWSPREGEDIDAVEVFTRSNGYDLGGLLNVNEERWKSGGLKEGQHRRVLLSVKKFQARRQSKRHQFAIQEVVDLS